MFSTISALEMTIAGNSNGTSGDWFRLKCIVFVADSLHVNPIIHWSTRGSGISGSNVTGSDTIHISCSSMRTLTFTSLSTLHGAEYTCQAVSSIPTLNIMTATVNESIIISVKSE